MGAPLNPKDTPTLAAATETSPSDCTFYFNIDLQIAHGKGQSAAAPMTAVYVPNRTKLQSPFDVLLYFHGHKKTSGLSIQDYLKDADFALRDFILTSSKRDVLLVAPTLGDKSAFGDLESGATTSAYLEQILNGVHKHLLGGQGSRPTIGKIVLAAHSGGGSPMKTMAQKSSETDVGKLIKEVWCLDSTYGNGQFWLNWATSAGRTLQRLFVFSTGSWDSEVLKDPKKPKGPDNPVVGTKRTGTGDDARVILNGAKGKSNIEVLIKPAPPKSNQTTNFTYGVAAGHNQAVGFYFTQLVNSSTTLSS
jgi:hypothetical protein